jgi:transcription elongation factor Elf1
MSTVATLLRHCPACGRRFEVRIVGKNLTSTKREAYSTTRAGTSSLTRMAAHSGLGNVKSDNQLVWDGHVAPEERVQVTVERREFQYTYRCKHCGHQWAEKRSEETQPSVEKKRI